MSKLISRDYKQSIFSLMRFLSTNKMSTKIKLFRKTSKLAFRSLKFYEITYFILNYVIFFVI